MRRVRARHRWVLVLGLAMVCATLPGVQSAHADNELVGGIGDLVGGVFAIPMGVLQGTLSGPPIIGTIGGALGGTIQALGLTVRGLLRLVGIAVPIATSLAPLLPLAL